MFLLSHLAVWALLLLAMALLGTGLLLLVACLWQGWQAQESAVGVVISHATATDEDGVRYFCPKVAFFAAGQCWRIEDWTAIDGTPAYSRGQAVRVYFPPGCPQEARLLRFRDVRTALLLSLLGAVLLALAGFSLHKGMANVPSPPGSDDRPRGLDRLPGVRCHPVSPIRTVGGLGPHSGGTRAEGSSDRGSAGEWI